MNEKKWRYIGGHLYRLSEVFDSGRDTVLLARTLKQDRCVVISKTDSGQWAVYWRARVEIPAKQEIPYTTA
ncbi:MAG: hypothetical protein P1Q69_00310 [Candidatus Thorarchaeota archaeon]|nr:hypothetical protein [Candidatus Thorarchaeota archaeon]